MNRCFGSADLTKGFSIFLTATFLAASSLAQSPVTLTVDSAHPGAAVRDDFIGLSFETQMLLPDKEGRHYFRPDNQPLVALFRLLGIKSLRIGGNTADRATVPVPGPADIDSLFAFAKAAGSRVIYTLRLRAGNRDHAAAIAKFIYDRYRPLLNCFAIGNEPNVFAREYPAYRDEWRNYFAAITSPTNAPTAMFCGPSATPGRTGWARDFANDFGPSGHIAFISQHDYPGGAGNRATNVAAARDRMLSPAWLAGYQKFHDSFVPAALTNGLRHRLEEVNNFFNGGAKEVSDTFAAALWGLDYLHWWAAHGADGINFHTGDNVAAGESMNPCRYATFVTSETGYHVRPIGYGIKAFDLGGHGRVVPVTISSSPALNLTAYAVLAEDHSLFVTLLNKTHDSGARDAAVDLAPGEGYRTARVLFLTAPGGDVAARTGVTLGGAEISDDAHWAGQWTDLPPPKDGRFTVKLPATTAAVIRLNSK